MRALLLSMAAALSLPAMTAEEVTPENLAAALSAAGYEAYIDADGDAAVLDQYGMEYWIISYPEENRLWIQRGWAAADGISSSTAYSLMNESNRQMQLIRSFYEPMSRIFCCDYDLYYPASGLDDAFFVSIMEAFFAQAGFLTDYLIGEGAI